MKVAQITTVFPPYRGGIGQVAYNYSLGLKKAGLDVEVITVDFAKREKQNFPVHYIKPWLKWGKAGFCPQIFFQLKKYDLVQLHYPSFGLAEVVWLWKIFNPQKKLVIFYHHDVIGSGLLGKIFSWHKKFMMPRILKSADKVIVSSFDYARNSDIKDIYQQHENKFTELPFGVGNQFIPQPDRKILQEFGIGNDKKIVLFVGGLDRNHYFKGADKLIQAICELKFDNYHLVMVGGGELISDLEDLAKRLKIKDKVTFAGWQSDEKLVKFYQAADLFVLPSIDRSEAFGLVLTEAMACGLPVIASDLPGVRSVVKNNSTGLLVPPGDTKKLAQAIEKILKDDQVRKSFSYNAVEHVKNNYRWDGIIRKLIEIYR